MARNITTVLDKTEILAQAVSDNDVLYLIHGTGSSRDKWIKVGELKKVMSVLGDVIFNSIGMHKAGENSQTSDVAFDGEKLIMSASGESVTDNSSLNISRLLQKFQRSISGGGSISSEITPAGVVVKVESNNDAVQLEIRSDKISFKSGIPLTEHASITFGKTNSSLMIDANEILFGNLINAINGVKGDVITDMIQPKTEGSPITIGGGTVTNGRASADRLNLASTSHITSSSDIILNIAANASIESQVGDIVVVENTGGSDIVVTMGYRPGSAGFEYKEMSLPAYCSMAFICISFFKDPNTHAITSEWSPMSDVSVSWNTQGA